MLTLAMGPYSRAPIVFPSHADARRRQNHTASGRHRDDHLERSTRTCATADVSSGGQHVDAPPSTALAGRSSHCAVGRTEMIVWGGYNGLTSTPGPLQTDTRS